jgi:hypothetical protein
MGYFSSIAESAFKENPNGEGWLYYPNGVIGKGYLVTDLPYKDKLFKFQKRVYMFILPLGFLYGLALDFSNIALSDFYLLIILLTPVYIRQYLLVKKLPRSNVKLKAKEAIATASRGFSSYYFYFMYFSSAFLISIGLSAPLLFNKPYSEVMDLTIMLAGSGLFFLAVTLILHKLKKSNK